MKIACYTDIHNQQTMLQIPTVLRGSAVTAIELTKKEWGKADIALIGGDNVSDYPHWNKSCALPYKNWLDMKRTMVEAFATVAKDSRVLYVDGNNDLILGDLPTKENPPYNTCEFYFSGPMKETLGVLAEEDYIAKYAASKGEQAGLHLLCFHYVVDGIDFFGLNIDPDDAFNNHDCSYNDEALQWLKRKLAEADPEGNKLIFAVGHLSATTVKNEESIVETMGERHKNALYDAFSGHSNLFYLYGHVHGQGYTHAESCTAVLHFDETGKPYPLPKGVTDSREVLKKDDKVSFHTVHMGGLRPFYQVVDGVNLYFEEDNLRGQMPWDDREHSYPSTATPKLAQYLLIETFDDRVEFKFRNTGSFEGFTPTDIPTPYTVWLK